METRTLLFIVPFIPDPELNNLPYRAIALSKVILYLEWLFALSDHLRYTLITNVASSLR